MSNIYAYHITKPSSLCVRYAFEEVGGEIVNDVFERMIKNLFGSEVVGHFQETAGLENLDFLREFERKKGKVDIETPTIKLKYPALLRECLHEKSGMTLESCIDKQGWTDEVTLITDKLIFNPKFIEPLFEEPINRIFASVENVINKSGCVDNTIVLVGGFSESLYVKEELSKRLKGISSEMNVVTPGNASLHIIKGAIILGMKILK